MSNTDQIAYWNGQAGEKWVRHAERLDALLEPFADELLETASLNEGEHVLDVGCGAGALTLKAAFRVGEKRGAVGIDVSKPLLSLAERRARERGALASFEKADAAFYRSERPVDVLISRFGSSNTMSSELSQGYSVNLHNFIGLVAPYLSQSGAKMPGIRRSEPARTPHPERLIQPDSALRLPSRDRSLQGLV